MSLKGGTERHLYAETVRQILSERDIVTAIYRVRAGGRKATDCPFVGVVKKVEGDVLTVFYPDQYNQESETCEYLFKDGKYWAGIYIAKIERCRVLSVGDQVTFNGLLAAKKYTVCLSDSEPGLIFLGGDGELVTEESEAEMFFPTAEFPNPRYNLPELKPLKGLSNTGQALSDTEWQTPIQEPLADPEEAVREVCHELREWVDDSIVKNCEMAQEFFQMLNTNAMLRDRLASYCENWLWEDPPHPQGTTSAYMKVVHVLQRAQALVKAEQKRIAAVAAAAANRLPA